MASQVRIQGIKEFDDILMQLPIQVQKKIIIPALIAAGMPIRDAARRRASSISKTLAAGIGTIRKLPRNAMATGPVVGIGPRAGKKYKNDAWFAPFIEWGTSGIGRFVTKGKKSKSIGKNVSEAKPDSRFTYTKGGSTDIFKFMFSHFAGSQRYRKDQSAHPFMRPAIDEALGQTKSVLVKELNKSMDAFVKKYKPSFFDL